jgi:hypothetical protein
MTTHDHVRKNTSPPVNQEIREEASRRIEEVRDDPAQIRNRLAEIDAEWNVERALELTSASITLFALTRSRTRMPLLALTVQAFLLQHAVRGWCPPLPVLRRLGFRTQQEIERERYTLRSLLREHVGVSDNDRPAELPAQPVAEDDVQIQ